MTNRWIRVLSALAVCSTVSGCAVLSFLAYAVWPDYPLYVDGDKVELSGLVDEVTAIRRPDGLWRVVAVQEADGMRVLGYLQARDRMGQLDLFRHLARGEVASLVGNRPFAGTNALDVDRMNRFLGFRRDAGQLLAHLSAEERVALDAFVAGINAWIAGGTLSLEHRLLGVEEVRPWVAEDSLAIYLMVMHGLGGNADREIRRLAIACAAGIEAMQRVWPTDMDYDFSSLPDEALGPERYAVAPSVVPEVAAALPALCGSGGDTEASASIATVDAGLASAFEHVWRGWSASNNWVVSGQHTVSGSALFSSDPHLPHMNPPMIWGFDFETADYRTAGFTLPGLYRVVFGHNGSVAWGATTNHVDRQDLVIHKPMTGQRDGVAVEGYELDGRFVPFELRTEEFAIRGGEPVTATVRFTRDGPLMNDLTEEMAEWLPLVAFRTVPVGRGLDLDGARLLSRARTVADFATAIDHFDLGCSSWLAADTSGSIVYRAPCLVPVRDGWRGTFPIAGWLSRYDWQGQYPKDELPTSFDPARGWLATANNQIVPADAFPSTYNNGVSAPDRVRRISQRLSERFGSIDVESSSSIQTDLTDSTWSAVRPQLEAGLCRRRNGDRFVDAGRESLCQWNGEMAPESVAATLYTLLTLSMLDRGLADDLPGGPDGELWKFVQSLVQFEANVRWLWTRLDDAPVWDDVTTDVRETRDDILELALVDAVAQARQRYGDDMSAWTWGEVRPFVLEHPFAAASEVLGAVVNSAPLAIGGGNETVFKHQFPRSRRSDMKVAIGPIVRLTVDMADPWAARFALAGGESGWARSPHYADLLEDWATGKTRPLTPADSDADVTVRFVPPAPGG